MKSKTVLLTIPLLVLANAPAALADEPAGGAAPQGGDDQGAPPQGGVTVIQLPPAQGGPSYPGNLPPAGFDPNGHLNSSSRAVTDTSHSTDGFDFGRGTNGPVSVRGSATGSYVVEGQFLPESHPVRRGDTLWDISNRYYQSPYQWPRIWAFNPQIQNPHWIYPGDLVRLLPKGMLVATELPILTGEALLVSFRAPRSNQWFDQPATVARVVHGRRPEDSGRCLGLHFSEIGAVDRARLWRLLRDLPPAPRARPWTGASP